MYGHHQVQKATKLTFHNFSLCSRTISIANFNNLLIVSITIIISTNSPGKDSDKYCYNCKHTRKNITHAGLVGWLLFYIKQQLLICPERPCYKDEGRCLVPASPLATLCHLFWLFKLPETHGQTEENYLFVLSGTGEFSATKVRHLPPRSLVWSPGPKPEMLEEGGQISRWWEGRFHPTPNEANRSQVLTTGQVIPYVLRHINIIHWHY